MKPLGDTANLYCTWTICVKRSYYITEQRGVYSNWDQELTIFFAKQVRQMITIPSLSKTLYYEALFRVKVHRKYVV